MTFTPSQDQNFIDLYTLQLRVREGVEQAFPDYVWVKAEISGMDVKSSGHCYLELSQSDSSGVVAKARAVIWRSKFTLLSAFFESVTLSPLSTGMEILCRVQVNYHEVWGFSLVIDDLNPEYTLGQKESLRRRTVERLEKEGLIDLQKELVMRVPPYRLAVISAPGAAGLGDFRRHIDDNEYGFRYRTDFFPSTMQGQDAPASIISSLDLISSSGVDYDAVLIMRGGGSELDLACFDDYSLAAAIARFPVPVFTAIGHEKDYHVADMVANTFVKTPTALADLIIDASAGEDQRISSFESRLRLAFTGRFQAMESALSLLSARIFHDSVSRLLAESSRIDLIEARIAAANPMSILSKGYSLVLDSRGVRLESASRVRAGDRMTVLFSDGRIEGTVDSVKADNMK